MAHVITLHEKKKEYVEVVVYNSDVLGLSVSAMNIEKLGWACVGVVIGAISTGVLFGGENLAFPPHARADGCAAVLIPRHDKTNDATNWPEATCTAIGRAADCGSGDPRCGTATIPNGPCIK